MSDDGHVEIREGSIVRLKIMGLNIDEGAGNMVGDVT
jgi:hypothetical protein